MCNVKEEVEKIVEEICDKYCKHPQEYDMSNDENIDKIYEDHCNNFPLMRLV